MTKFATIDLNSGFVWWVGEAESAVEACHKSDAENGNQPDGAYVEISVSEAKSTAGGYAVYEVPADFDVSDGQNEEEIAAACSHPLIGYFRAQ